MKDTIRKKLQKNSGVTLLALSITIIVLIILARVSINLLTGDKGVITRSKEIRRNIEQAKIEGQEKINSLKDQATNAEDGSVILDDNIPPTISMSVTNITDSSFKVSVNVTETGSGLAKVEYSIDDGEHYITPNNNQAKSYTFTDLKVGFEEYNVKVKVTDVNNNSSYASQIIKGEEIEEPEKPVTDLKQLKVGDYVNYTYDTTSYYSLRSTVSGYSSNQTISQTKGLKWRILSINDDGSVDLVSATPTDTSVYFGGALGYNNGVWALNDMCEKLYSNNSLGIKARSININDIEKNETAEATKARLAYINVDGAKYGSVKTYTDNTFYPELYAYENGSGINTTTVKKDGIGVSEAYYTKPTTSQTCTQATRRLTATQTNYEIPLNSTNYGTAGAVISSRNEYWLASRSTRCRLDYIDFCIATCSTRLTDGNYTCASNEAEGSGRPENFLRPLVSLVSNTINTSLGKDANGAWQIKM